jgi:hypothetical protein
MLHRLLKNSNAVILSEAKNLSLFVIFYLNQKEILCLERQNKSFFSHRLKPVGLDSRH